MKYAIVTTTGAVEVREVEVLDVKDVQAIVGGDVEQMPSPPDIVVLAAETPASQVSYNWAATRLCQQYLMPTDRIFGTAIITGPADDEGDPTDVPEQTVFTLTEWYEHRQ